MVIFTDYHSRVACHVLTLICVAGLFLVGCSAADATPETEQLAAFAFNGSDEVDALYERRDRLQAEYITVCMAEQGFDYDPAGDASHVVQREQNVADSSFGWVESLRESVIAPSDELATSAIFDEDETPSAYQTSLWGTGIGERADERDGCYWTALNRAEQESGVTRLRLLSDELSIEMAGIVDSPEYGQLQDEWARYMSSSGYDVQSVEDMHALVSELWDRLERNGEGDTEAVELETSLFVTNQECGEERDAWFESVLIDSAADVLAREG